MAVDSPTARVGILDTDSLLTMLEIADTFRVDEPHRVRPAALW